MEQLRTPDLVDAIGDAIESRLFDLNVALPAKVLTFDSTQQSCTVQPLLKDRVVQDDGTVVAQSMPVIAGVPVLSLGSSTTGFRVQFDLSAGDFVLLVFSQRSLDKWLTQGGEVDPLDSRLHHLSDAIAIPGLLPLNSPWSGDGFPSIGYQGGAPRLGFTSTQIQLGGTQDNVARSSKVVALLNQLMQLLTSWPITPEDGGASLQAAAILLSQSPDWTDAIAAVGSQVATVDP